MKAHEKHLTFYLNKQVKFQKRGLKKANKVKFRKILQILNLNHQMIYKPNYYIKLKNKMQKTQNVKL